MPGYSKSEPTDAKSEPKGEQSEPKGSQSEPKGSQGGAKGNPKWAKWSQKGAKGEPKGDQNASKNRPSEKVAKRESQNGAAHPVQMVHFGSHFQWTIGQKIDAEIDAEKVMNMEENRCENGTEFNRKIWWFSKGRFAKKRVLWKMYNHANHYIHAVE